MKKLIALSLVAGCLLAVVYVFPLKTENEKQQNTAVSEQGCEECPGENQEAENPQEKRNNYFPETAEDVAKFRNEYWEKHHTFKDLLRAPENLRLGGFAANWIDAGPSGGKKESPYDSGLVHSGKILAIEQDYSNRRILYAGTSGGGFWRSLNLGKTWKVTMDNLPCPSVSAVTCNPSYAGEVWLGTGGQYNSDAGEAAPLAGYLYKSVDYGKTFAQVSFTSTPTTAKINKIMIPVLYANIIVIGTNDGIYISINHGNNFLKSPLFSGSCTDVADASDWILFGTNTFRFVAAKYANDTLFRYNYSPGTPSSIVPANLQKLKLPGSPAIQIRTVLATSRSRAHDIMYASMGRDEGWWGGVWISTDKGATWRNKPMPFASAQMNYNSAIAVKNFDGKSFYLGTNHTNFDYSDDSLATWKVNISPYSIHADHHSICTSWSDNDTIFMGGDAGFFIFRNNGAIVSAPGRLRNFLAKGFAINPNNPFDRYIATWDNGIYHTSSGLKSDWTEVGCCDGADVAYSPVRHLFTIVNGGVFTWDPASGIYYNNNSQFVTGFTQTGYDLVKFNGTNFYANQGLFIYKTTGTNLPWSKVGGTSQTFDRGVISMDINSSGKVAGGTWGDPSPIVIPIRVMNSSSQFVYPTSGPAASATWWGGKTCYDVKYGTINSSNGKQRVYAALSGISGMRVVKSNDEGTSYVNITGNLPANIVNVRRILPDDADTNIIYIGSDLGVYATVDGGANWYNFSDNLPGVTFINDMEFATINSIKYIFASSYGRGLWYSRTLAPTYRMQQTLTGSDDVICNIFPNPVKNELNIRLEDASAETATLMIYDAQGKLIREEKEISITDFLIKISCAEFKPGIYLVTIFCNNHKVQKKFIKT